jgi:hypothetical protein
MMKKLLMVGVVALAAVKASSALGFDREPVGLRLLKPDGWGNSTTAAARDVRSRYKATGATYCTGVIMVGHEKDSTWVHGTTRIWDKLFCAADVGSEYVSFVYDAKGAKAESFTIYRLKHIAK